ncbi:hypothetical protein PHO31112_00545 [Pandoraea horticolens]|uniref:Uncharacterized protein n=1 Tax=Pandoraea horticolens TaxID=2508298 RepID=A0A5E4S3N2_9BURK|nr:hypothetical protein PHO31112_00545 [Pandoraea horticolens]
MTLTELLIPTFSHMLRGLSAWLDKAAAYEKSKSKDPDALMTLRLAPDMYPLAAQVRFASYQAMEPAYRLRSEPIPETLLALQREGWNAEHRPGTFAEAKACLANTIAFLDTLSGNALDAGEYIDITLELPQRRGLRHDRRAICARLAARTVLLPYQHRVRDSASAWRSAGQGRLRRACARVSAPGHRAEGLTLPLRG